MKKIPKPPVPIRPARSAAAALRLPVLRRAGMRWLVLLLFPAMLYTLSGCHGVRGRKPSSPSLQELDACLDREALLSFGTEEKERCISLLERFLAPDTKDPASDRAALQLCRFYMEKRDFSAAYNLLLLFPEQYPKSRDQALAKLYLGICLYYMDDCYASLNILQPLMEDPGARELSEEISRYLAENYVKLDKPLSALTWYEKCDGLLQNEDARTALRKRVLEVLARGWDRTALDQAEQMFPEGFFHEAVQLGTASGAFRNGELRLTENRLRDLASRHPDDLFTPFIQSLYDQIAQEGLPAVCTVGCLLPLTGKYARFGKSILDALVLGVGAFQDPGEGRITVRLMVRDTGGDPETAVKQLLDLAENPRVMGVVGPLLATVSQACAPEAQKAGFPMISLTQREDVAQAGDFVFQNGLTIRQQVETLVQYAMEDLGLTQFAILYPDDDYGIMARDSYREKVLEMGGEIVAEASYQGKETDFQKSIRSLVGEKYWKAMKLREAKEKKKSDLLRRAARAGSSGSAAESSLLLQEEEEEESLTLPFEALFVPDNHKKASLIAPYLAFYDLNEVVLLGNNAWNSVRLLEEAGDYVRDAVFVDGFFADSDMPHVAQFVEAFEREFDRKPRVLEAQGYDSLLILEDAFYQASPKTRFRIREAIAQMQDYPGLSGATSFDQDGCAIKRLYLLTVLQNRIQQIH